MARSRISHLLAPQIIEVLEQHPLEALSVVRIAEAIKRSKKGTKSALQALVESGTVEEFKYGGYILVESKQHPALYKVNHRLRSTKHARTVEDHVRAAKGKFQSDKPPRSVQELREALGCSMPRVYEVIKVLQEKGHLTRDRKGLHYHKEPVEPEIFDLV